MFSWLLPSLIEEGLNIGLLLFQIWVVHGYHPHLILSGVPMHLTTHISGIHDNTLYRCSKCGKGFKQQPSVMRHIKNEENCTGAKSEAADNFLLGF